MIKHLTKLIILVTSCIALNALAAKPRCYDSSGGFCQYEGTIYRIYINSGNLILIYFDTKMDDKEWEVAGFNANSVDAAAIHIDDNPEFAKLFYSTALSAQATKRSVTIQMRGTVGNYLKADRIWLNE